jgi:hypothetical protein
MADIQPLLRRPAPQPLGGSENGKFDHLVRPRGMVHRTLFTDPAIFEREMTPVFGGTTVCLQAQGNYAFIL